MRCPRCNSELNEVAKDSVMIDVCSQCRGVWLDRGELDKLISRVDSYDHHEYSSHHDDHHDSDHNWKHENEGHHGHNYEEHNGYHKKKKKSGIMDIFDIFG